MDNLINRAHCMDCFELLALLPDASIDMFATDLPYGTTACAWDEIIPFEPMWKEVKRTLKPRGVFVTTASQPFTSKLVMSNVGMFKYSWVWQKNTPTGFLNANRQPMKYHEDVVVFYEGQCTYNPQLRKGVGFKVKAGIKSENYGKQVNVVTINDGTQYLPSSIVHFANENGNGKVHSTQKPVALYEYLIRTYTQPGEMVCDFCCGSGTTGVAARNTGRRFIINDNSQEYFEVVTKRLAEPFTLPMFD